MREINLFIVSGNKDFKTLLLSIILLQKNFNLAGTVTNEADAIIKSEQLKPDVIIIDKQTINEMEIETFISILKRKNPLAGFVIIYKDNQSFQNNKYQGGIIYIKKDSIQKDGQELIIAIKAAKKGGLYISNTFRKLENDKNPSISLSASERGIVKGIAMGMSDPEIAEYLNFSRGSVRNILSELKEKIPYKNRIQLVLYCIYNGLIKFDIGFNTAN